MGIHGGFRPGRMKQRNHVREIVESGERAVGLKVHFHSEMMIELVGYLGLDYAWLDMEHHGPSPADSLALERYARAADAAGIDLVLKHPAKYESQITQIHKALEAGVRNLIITQVEDADQVRRLVKSTRYSYQGGKGGRHFGGGRVSAWGEDLDWDHGDPLTDREDAAVMIGVIFENASAVENAEEILQVPEVGFAMIGSVDLSASLGHPLELQHPDCVEAERKVLDAIRENDIPMGFTLHHLNEAEGAIDRGLGYAQREDLEYPNIQLVNVGSDKNAVVEEIQRRLDVLGDQL